MITEIPLDDEQLKAVAHMQQAGFKGVLWMKPGTGKTRCGLKSSQLSGCRRVYVICPKRAIPAWEDEITKLQFAIPYIILSADSFLKGVNEADDFRNMFLIVDEAYYFANPNSARSKNLRRFSMNFPYKLALSGTIQPAGDNITIWGAASAIMRGAKRYSTERH